MIERGSREYFILKFDTNTIFSTNKFISIHILNKIPILRKQTQTFDDNVKLTEQNTVFGILFFFFFFVVVFF